MIKGLKNYLLGLPAITALNLAARIDVAEPEDYCRAICIVQRYPNLFRGLGNLGKQYETKLIPNHKPHALYTLRRVPLPLQDKVKKELSRMESLGVISKVDEPSAWCAGMVAVPKQCGSVRICDDLRPLNKNVLR